MLLRSWGPSAPCCFVPSVLGTSLPSAPYKSHEANPPSSMPKVPFALNIEDVQNSLRSDSQWEPPSTLDLPSAGCCMWPGAPTSPTAHPSPTLSPSQRHRKEQGRMWGSPGSCRELELFSPSEIFLMCTRCRLNMRNTLIEVSQLLNAVDMYQLHHSPNLYQCVSNNQLASH